MARRLPPPGGPTTGLQLLLGLLVRRRPRRPRPPSGLHATPQRVACTPALARALLGQALLDLTTPTYDASARAWLEGADAVVPWQHVCHLLDLDPDHGRKLAALLPDPTRCVRCPSPRMASSSRSTRYCPTHHHEARRHHRGLLADGKHAHAHRVRSRTLAALALDLLGARKR